MSRRLNNEGHISKHKGSGLWRIIVTQNSVPVTQYAKTQKEAKAKLRELTRSIEDGVHTVNSNMAMRDYLNEWLKLTEPRLKPKTFKSYEAIVRVHLIPRFGRITLKKLTTEHINKVWATMIKDGHSAAVIEHCHRRLSASLNHAIQRKLIVNNPIKFVTKPRNQAKEMHILSNVEMEQVLEAARAGEYYTVIVTALHTGMRLTELLGLRWKDINIEEAVLHVSNTIYVGTGGKIIDQTPKTKSSRRSIDMTPSLAIHLRKEWEKQVANGLLHGYQVTGDSPVMIRTTGKRLLPRSTSGGFKKIVTKLGLDAVRFHDLRHSHATMMLIQGVHPKVVQERLGHAKISTTMDIYSHVMPSLQKDAAQKFELGLKSKA